MLSLRVSLVLRPRDWTSRLFCSQPVTAGPPGAWSVAFPSCPWASPQGLQVGAHSPSRCPAGPLGEGIALARALETARFPPSP